MAVGGCGDRPSAGPGTGDAPCSRVSRAAAERLVHAYRTSGGYPARQRDGGDGTPASISVVIPPIRFAGPTTSPQLPVGPCQTIFRFRYPVVRSAGGAPPSPFRYLEIDWNTEGRPRGPNGSFRSAHFDFHFYLRSRAWIDAHVDCPSSDGRVCDPLRTPYPQMRRFLALPPPSIVPPGYRPDVGSSIPRMGLHVLDSRVHYSVREVDRRPTLFYGTFAGRMLFAEASVTLKTLQDVRASPGRRLAFRYRPPAGGAMPFAWPRRFTIAYRPASGAFEIGFSRFLPPHA